MTFYRFHLNPERKILFTVVFGILITALSVFLISRWHMEHMAATAIQSRAKVVNAYAVKYLKEKSFAEINTHEDMKSKNYDEMQELLNHTRELVNVRYLYTAKFNAAGNPVYLVDGLPPEAEDFRVPGAAIEKDIVPLVSRCLRGEVIEPDEVLHTNWGAIYLTCTPIEDDHGFKGAMLMEFDADAISRSFRQAMFWTGLLSAALTGVFILLTVFSLRRLATPFYRKLAYTDALTGLGNRTAFEVHMQSLSAKDDGTAIIVYDLNKMKYINDSLGHAAGDAFLCRMADFLRREPPSSRGDSYRIGGDEFVTIVSGKENLVTLEQQLAVAQTKAQALTQKGDYLSYAYGVALYSTARDGKNFDTVLRRADSAMYTQKKQMHSPAPAFYCEMPEKGCQKPALDDRKEGV